MKRQDPYLGGAVDRSFAVHYDGPLRAVTVKLHRVELAQLYRSGVADGGHAGAHIEPSEHEREHDVCVPFQFPKCKQLALKHILNNHL